MEKFIESLPKPVLALLAIVVGIIVIMLINPPHTVCDTQEATFRESQKGSLFTNEVDKKKIPGTLAKAKEACQLGNSGGSCFEYFTSLRQLADGIGKATSECMGQLYGIPEVSLALNDGIELMVRMAWGVKPPEPGPERFNWMQESEIAVFCRLKSIYIRANGEEAWTQLRQRIYPKLPGEEVKVASDPAMAVAEPKPANLVFTEEGLWNRSLFSVRCDSY